MSSKKIFSWSKRQSSSDTYYRTGGLLSIDASPDLSVDGVEAKVWMVNSGGHDALA